MMQLLQTAAWPFSSSLQMFDALGIISDDQSVRGLWATARFSAFTVSNYALGGPITPFWVIRLIYFDALSFLDSLGRNLKKYVTVLMFCIDIRHISLNLERRIKHNKGIYSANRCDIAIKWGAKSTATLIIE